MQVFQVNFGGGEPFLRDDFLDILRYAHAAGHHHLREHQRHRARPTTWSTSSCAWTAPVYLQVSLDGACAETNDAIRGAGHVRAHPGAASSSWRSAAIPTSASTWWSRASTSARSPTSTRWPRVRRQDPALALPPVGRRLQHLGGLPADPRAAAELAGFLGDHQEILTGDSFFALTPDSRRELGLHMCGAAKMTCAVAPDGSVYPCAFLSDPAFLAGNVTAEPLADIFAPSPVFERFRDLEVESCRACDRFSRVPRGLSGGGILPDPLVGLPDPECLRASTARRRLT